MEGNFETSGGGGGGGFSGGGSIPDPGGSIEFDSGGNFSDAGDFASSSSDFTHLDYLKDGVDKGYYKIDTEGVFNLEDVMNEAQEEMSEGNKESEWDVMDIPGSSHEKLEALAEIDDEVVDEKEKNISVESFSTPEKAEMTFEQQIIKLQAEAIKLMSQSMNKEMNKKELEELLKQIRELMEESEKEKGNKKATLLAGLFSAVLILVEASEKGYKMVENEVKEAEK